MTRLKRFTFGALQGRTLAQVGYVYQTVRRLYALLRAAHNTLEEEVAEIVAPDIVWRFFSPSDLESGGFSVLTWQASARAWSFVCPYASGSTMGGSVQDDAWGAGEITKLRVYHTGDGVTGAGTDNLQFFITATGDGETLPREYETEVNLVLNVPAGDDMTIEEYELTTPLSVEAGDMIGFYLSHPTAGGTYTGPWTFYGLALCFEPVDYTGSTLADLRAQAATNEARRLALEAGTWQGVARADDHGVELTIGSGLQTIVAAPAAGTAKIVSGITVINATGSAATQTLTIHDGVNTFLFYIDKTVTAYERKTYPHTLVLPVGWWITANSSQTYHATAHVAEVPYGIGGDITYGCIAGDYIGTSRQTVIPAPPSGTKRIVRTVTLYNWLAASPTTFFGIEKVSTTTEYRIRNYAISQGNTSLWSDVDDCALVLDSDSRLVVQHSIDPAEFHITGHYMDVKT